MIQINPSPRDTVPRTMLEIADRRNELAGNLSLYQELRFIEQIDQMLQAGQLVQDASDGALSCGSSSCRQRGSHGR